jgi:hypothetical protein
LPGVDNERLVPPRHQYVRIGADFGFFEDIWKTIKKLFHKQQGAL